MIQIHLFWVEIVECQSRSHKAIYYLLHTHILNTFILPFDQSGQVSSCITRYKGKKYMIVNDLVISGTMPSHIINMQH